ncbi:hematopoietic prostaglandin D synthase-like [Ptychodera flava]|uniref:hematopoietic prostaglandin D synthase-like n=1 Tax=Ptychodera flava TaxID=63121 RepID=UPI00396A849D
MSQGISPLADALVSCSNARRDTSRSAMPTYKLTYFDLRGRAEPSRLLFAVAGVEYEDVRIQREQWPNEKASGKYPFGQMPVLEVDGQVIAQSIAIARYLANEFGLAGKTNLEKAKVDMIVDAIGDVSKGLGEMWFANDEAKKAEAKEKCLTKTIPTTFTGLEKILMTNNGGDGFFVGDSLTMADLIFLAHTDYHVDQLKEENTMAAFPKLTALRERILAQPSVKQWVEARPKTKI